MKKILLSLGIIAVAAGLIYGATGAFFSDSETSVANVFTAGSIDLKIGSTQTYNNAVCVNGKWELKSGESVQVSQYPVIGSDCGGTWVQGDLGPQTKFFNFDDIKPGDKGENDISFEVLDNDSWVCAAVTNLESLENTITGPEAKLSDTSAKGELDEEMVWTIWKDSTVLVTGNPTEGILALYDSTTGTPLSANTLANLKVEWELPTTSGNITQTDSLTGDIQFYAVQSRNNTTFKCSDMGQGEQPVILWTDIGTQPGGEASFIEESPRGNVLQLVTGSENSARVRWVNNSLNIDLDTFTGVSFESKQVSAINPAIGNATMRLIIDKDGDVNTPDTVEITYEPYYNIVAYNSLNDASILSNTWQTWKTTLANGKFWANGGFLGSTPNGGAYATNFTLQQVLTAHPDAKIIGISFGMGTWNPSQVVLVDNLIINGSSYSLEN